MPQDMRVNSWEPSGKGQQEKKAVGQEQKAGGIAPPISRLFSALCKLTRPEKAATRLLPGQA